jgi:hypothetical protein
MPKLDLDANTFYSSGMCKAGFAGDDAPRAVFRKYSEQDTTALRLGCRLDLIILNLSSTHLTSCL